MNGKRLLALLLAMIGLCSVAYAAGSEAPRLAYEMDVTLHGETLQETVRVTVVNDSADVWNEVCFRDYMHSVIQQAQGQTDAILPHTSGIISAVRDGVPLAVEADADDPSIVYVELKQPLQPGESAVLELQYCADIPDGGFRCAYNALNYSKAENRTYELAQFYPMLAVYEDGRWICDPYILDGECFYTRCADYSITLHAPAGYDVIASGDETCGQTTDGATEWLISAVNMRDVTIIVSNEYDVLTGDACGVTVNSYFAAQNEETADHRMQGEVTLQAALSAIEAFTEAYGAYPFAELDLMESCYEYGGMEAPGLVRISQLYSWFIGDSISRDDEIDYESRLQGTVAHEVAHEWFYGAVGNDQYNEAWLDESFAAFSEQVYWRSLGRSEKTIAETMREFAQADQDTGNYAVNLSYGKLGWNYTRAVYQRGAAFLYQLEQAMGADTFYAFMREYYAKFALSEAKTIDFIATLAPHIAENKVAHALIEKYIPQ